MNAFVNPADSVRYTWPRNHDVEGAEQAGLTRPVERTATTSGVGVVRQQGPAEPMQLVRTGVILTPAHHDHMVAWTKLGQDQTIYYEDAAGDSYEVLVTGFKSAPFSVGRNNLGGTIAPQHAWRYTLEMDVVAVLTGTWTSTTLTP